jgi:S-adenosylmethionine synthetase
MKITIEWAEPSHRVVETVERKGKGHPDTIADAISEAFSRFYSRYCLAILGRIPNHWTDKCLVIGAESEFTYGTSRLLRPVTVELVGKVTAKVGEQVIPLDALARTAAEFVLTKAYPLLDPEHDLVVQLRSNDNIGAGRQARWYRPSSAADIPLDVTGHTANDMAICSAFAPLSAVEQVTLGIERELNSAWFKQKYPMCGSDIKVITVRDGQDYRLAACVPAIASQVACRADYDEFKDAVNKWITVYAEERLADADSVTVQVNSRDDAATVYMSHLGGAIDTGDIGVTGRGNRANGLITPMRPMSIEAPCGKNPVYHSGKIYAVLAQWIAQQVSAVGDCSCEVVIVTETGRPLDDPILVSARVVGGHAVDDVVLRDAIAHFPEVIPTLAQGFADGDYELC